MPEKPRTRNKTKQEKDRLKEEMKGITEEMIK